MQAVRGKYLNFKSTIINISIFQYFNILIFQYFREFHEIGYFFVVEYY